MSISIWEEHRSPSFKVDRKSGSTIDVKYLLACTYDAEDNAASVELALRSNIPLTFLGLWLLNYGSERVGPYLWQGTVTYGPKDGAKADPSDPSNPEKNEPGPDLETPLTPEWDFDTTGASYRITQSLLTTIKAGPGSDTNDTDAPDYGKAIGVTKDGVEGVDIPPRGPIQLSTTRILPATAVTMGYIDTLVWLTNRTNDAAWWGRPEGEWIFLGAQGRTKSANEWAVTYQFNAGKKQTDIPIGSFTVAEKLPFEYLWVAYKDSSSNGRKVKVPSFAYVERVVGSGSFSSLGIT